VLLLGYAERADYPFLGSLHSNHIKYNLIFLYYVRAQSVMRNAHAPNSAVEVHAHNCSHFFMFVPRISNIKIPLLTL